MKEDIGQAKFPVWLIADSNPGHWESILEAPLDPRHPVRHNIWTAILDVVQDKVYRASRLRLDSSRLYIRNAVDNAAKRPKPTEIQWVGQVQGDIIHLRRLIDESKPVVVFCFGAFAFEFVRRAMGEEDCRKFSQWGARELGAEFRRRMETFTIGRTNIIPLLHRSISGGKFIQSHNYFCGPEGGNYFERVGGNIADKLLQHKDRLPIWIE